MLMNDYKNDGVKIIDPMSWSMAKSYKNQIDFLKHVVNNYLLIN